MPKAEDLTALGCKFEVTIAQPDDAKSKKREKNFAVKPKADAKFKISEAFVPNCNSRLFVRAMIVDPQYREFLIKCKDGHGHDGPDPDHILRCMNIDSIYEGDSTGFYPDNRLSIKTLCQPEIVYKVMCPNGCFLKSKGNHAILNLILEDENGNMYARRYFKFSVNSRPKDTSLNFDPEDGRGTKRKSKNDSVNTGGKKQKN